jgi:hypothetical protein
MISVDFVKEKIKAISSKDVIYYVFPVFFIAILYYSFLPFNQTYIGEWHDIFANSLYYTIVDNNYLATWNNLGAGGFPLIASPHSDKYYLISFPFYLIFQNLSIVNFTILLHLVIAYFAFFKFGSLITKNNNALLIFSLFFSFSGMLLGRIYAGHHLLLYGLVWIPLLYYFFLKIVLYEESTIINVLGLSIVSFLIYSTGNIYHFVLAYILMLVFFFYYAITGKVSKKILYILAISLILTLLLVSVKSIPDLGVSGSIIRNDAINPLDGGGAFETDLTSFVSGDRIDSLWAQYESGIMIGIIPLLLMIIAFVYGRKDIGVPAFFAVLFSVIWAAGGKTLLSFLHLLPIVNSFRNPGRIFGAILPIVLFLALYGAVLLYDMSKKGEKFVLSPDQKKMVITGIFLLVIVKLLELPFQELISIQSAISVILVAGFIALLYSGRGSSQNILRYLALALVVNILLLIQSYSVFTMDLLIPVVLLILLLAGLYIFIEKTQSGSDKTRALCLLLLAGIIVMTMGNLGSGYVKVYSPMLDKSPAPEIINALKTQPSENVQLWVYENGWAIQHMDFTYWDMINGIHPMSLYAAYYLKTMPQLTYNIGNTTYFAPDYIIDTQYLENGNQNIPEYTFKVQNISVYKPEHILPNAFIVRNMQVNPLKIEKFSPSEVIAEGQLKQGDVVILKSAYYPGWKVNDIPAENIGNMVGLQLAADTDRVSFTFDPLDFKIGAILSGIGVILILVLFLKRKDCDQYIATLSETRKSPAQKGKKKKDS